MSDEDRDQPADRADDPLDQWGGDAAETADRDQPEADPFERIGEEAGPRRGDPFDAFEGADQSSADADEVGEANGDESMADVSTDATDTADPARTDLPSGDDGDDPFATFDAPATDPFDERETVFTSADRGGIGDDDVWERMESTDSEAEAVPGKRYVDVNKHSYCETCEYFSAPPDVACSHEGTEILEFVDMETVRVVDCPVVDERNVLDGVD